MVACIVLIAVVGYLCLTEVGCGWQDVLVLNGEQRGTMWIKGEGWFPHFSRDEGHKQLGFLDVYERWLDGCLEGPFQLSTLLLTHIE